MSDQDDWDFASADDAKAAIRAAVRYLLEGTAGSDRGDIVREIIEIVGEVARAMPPGGQDPFDDELPGG
jgi:predicted RNA-binding protein with EMAP domain